MNDQHEHHSEPTAPGSGMEPAQAAPPVHSPPTNGMAISGFILGLVSVLSIFPCGLFMSVLAIIIATPCGIIGIILSALSRKHANQRGLGTAGLILSICGLCLAMLASILMIGIMVYALNSQPPGGTAH